MKWFEDIFTKSKLLIVSGIFSVAGYAFLAVTSLITGAPLFANYLIIAGLLALLLICYKKGETSCQKALAGAILCILMYAYWVIISGMYGEGSTGVKVLEIFMTVFLTVIFLNHLLLQIDHKGDGKVILVSQLMLVIAIVWQFAEMIAQILSGGQYYDIINSFSLLCAVTMITCMESRIQKYKARRSAAMKEGRWTEEERQKSKKIFKL